MTHDEAGQTDSFVVRAMYSAGGSGTVVVETEEELLGCVQLLMRFSSVSEVTIRPLVFLPCAPAGERQG